MYKYESTIKIYDYIKKSNELFIDKKLIASHLNISEDKINKALSDLNKEKDLFRIEKGKYLNLIEEKLTAPIIKNGNGEEKKFRALQKLLPEEYQTIQMFKSPLYIAYDYSLTTQSPNHKVILIEMNKNNNEFVNKAALFISPFIDKNNKVPKSYVLKNKNELKNIVIDLFSVSSTSNLDLILNLIENEYSELFTLSKDKEANEYPGSLSRLLYGNIDKEKYDDYEKQGLNNYILKVK